MNQATVEFRHVSKQYGPQGAVVDLSLTVPAGDICVLVGPSGCGKTTSLKMVNRLVGPGADRRTGHHARGGHRAPAADWLRHSTDRPFPAPDHR